MPNLALGLGTQYGGSNIDNDVAAFRAESGATDVQGLNTLVKYLKAESLYDNFVIFPKKSAQNAGSGSTVYSLGGLTANNSTLVNSPTWGTSGITYNGTNQYDTTADFLGSDTITVFSRVTPASDVDGNDGIYAQYDTGGDNRSWRMIHDSTANRSILLSRSPDGTSANLEQYSGTTDLKDTERTIVAQWIDGGGRSAWLNKTSESISLFSGSAQTSRKDTAVNVTFGAYFTSGTASGFWKGTAVANAILTGNVTTAQRERITDLINAL